MASQRHLTVALLVGLLGSGLARGDDLDEEILKNLEFYENLEVLETERMYEVYRSSGGAPEEEGKRETMQPKEKKR